MYFKYLSEDVRKRLFARPTAIKGVLACIENEICAVELSKNKELLEIYSCSETAVLVNRDLIDEVVTMLLGKF